MHLFITDFIGICGICGTPPEIEDAWNEKLMRHEEEFACRACGNSLKAIWDYYDSSCKGKERVYTLFKGGWSYFNQPPGISLLSLKIYRQIKGNKQKQAFIQGWKAAMEYGKEAAPPPPYLSVDKDGLHYWVLGKELFTQNGIA